ncbi:MAG TPA: ZIP family metal transporter [Thermoanaerobaculia bacterium]|nr:ZIP family metal transporter [Thermoanaerobaculia bacterium]
MSAVWAISAFLMTLAGGLFAFRYQRYLLYIMAFSAGVLVGVAFLDLLPTIFDLSRSTGTEPRQLMLAAVFGFVGIFLLEKLTIIHSEKQHDAPGHQHHVGLIGAIGLSFHSFLDGLAIGVGFKAGTEVGIVVLLAVLAHDFADGLNTVTFMLASRNSNWRTGTLLAIDALAPIAGALMTNVIQIQPRMLAFQLSFFAGFLLYLGASDLLPHVHERPKAALVLSTIGGLFAAGLVVYTIEHVHG